MLFVKIPQQRFTTAAVSVQINCLWMSRECALSVKFPDAAIAVHPTLSFVTDVKMDL